MRDFISVAKALGDENRLRAFMALRGRELCACQIVELLDLAPSTVSKHMSILKQARLVEGRKDGRWMYYRLADDDVPPAAGRAIEWACDSLKREPRIREDASRLKQIVKLDPEELCRRHTTGMTTVRRPARAPRRTNTTEARKHRERRGRSGLVRCR